MLIYIEDYLRRRASRASVGSRRVVAGGSAATSSASTGIAPKRRMAAALALAVVPSEPAVPSTCELGSVYAEATLI